VTPGVSALEVTLRRWVLYLLYLGVVVGLGLSAGQWQTWAGWAAAAVALAPFVYLALTEQIENTPATQGWASQSGRWAGDETAVDAPDAGRPPGAWSTLPPPDPN
jgi:hypothetical protein